MFSGTHPQEFAKETPQQKREKAVTKKASGCRKSKKDATPAAWVKLVRRAWMVSFAFRSSNSSTGQEVTTQTHTGSASNQSRGTNKNEMGMKNKNQHTKECVRTEGKKKQKMHANHGSKKHMQQRIMGKPAKWQCDHCDNVCSSVTFKINLSGFKWKFNCSWSEQKYRNCSDATSIPGAVWQRIFLSSKNLINWCQATQWTATVKVSHLVHHQTGTLRVRFEF